MAFLAKKELLKEINSNNLIVDFKEENLKNSSYEL